MTEFEAGRPVVLRGGTVLPMDATRLVILRIVALKSTPSLVVKMTAFVP